MSVEISIQKANEIKFKIAKEEVTVTNKDGRYSINLKEQEIIKPGEYGFLFSHFTALENTQEKYEGKINIINLSSQSNVHMLIPHTDIIENEITKENLAKLTNLNVILLPISTNSKIKAFAKKYQPEVVIFVKDFFSKTEDKDTEQIKKDFNIVDQNKKFKFKDSEFNSEEDSATQYYILN